jgi:putative endonuclease
MVQEGWSIVERNWRRGPGELDIVAFRDGVVAFVEVKAIDGFGTEGLAVSVGPRKRARIVETSKLFLAMHREFSSATVRFDVASVRSGAMADYYENAFAERT